MGGSVYANFDYNFYLLFFSLLLGLLRREGV